MKLDKAKLASGDTTELLKLARSIKPTTSLSKQEHPLASQFFDDEPSGVRHLSTDVLAESLAGAESIEHFRWVEYAAQAGYAGIERPKAAGDVTLIGAGSGWNAPKPAVASGAKAERALLLHKIAKTVNPSSADTAILTATLKSIITQLLGVNVESVDPGVLKSKLAATIKARPDLGLRLAKALGTAPEMDVSLDDLVRMGATVEKTANTLHISV
jgi:hypothetical protein